jgi:hypothetical protein
MPDNNRYTMYAIMHELNNRAFRKKLDLFPEELRYYVILAISIIGAENAKRVKSTPGAVVKDGEEFVSKLLALADPGKDGAFAEVLETCLVEMMRDELRCCCPNCAVFEQCIDIDNVPVGDLFERRVRGEESEGLKQLIVRHIDATLSRTPYVDTDMAHRLCGDFRHQYSASGIGEVFGRYADIASALQASYNIDYRKIQQKMVLLNMDFCEKASAGEGR